MHYTSFKIYVSLQSVKNYDNRISTWFSFCDRVCKLINAKVDDRQLWLLYCLFLCEKFRVYRSKTISNFSKLDI